MSDPQIIKTTLQPPSEKAVEPGRHLQRRLAPAKAVDCFFSIIFLGQMVFGV
jgi:hypothetical protein